ncbi:hypothetical protein, partial [Bacillus mycoides]|uniref:hypothetical protein n=1 Tax=Bacillus mycoides TaxID=1405 RepID=UPI003A80DA68
WEVGHMLMKPDELSDKNKKLLSETTYSLDELVGLLGWFKAHIIQMSSELAKNGYKFPLNGAGKRIYTNDALMKIRKVNEFSDFGMSIGDAAQKVMETPNVAIKTENKSNEDMVVVPADIFSQILQTQSKAERLLIDVLGELKDVKEELKELKRK